MKRTLKDPPIGLILIIYLIGYIIIFLLCLCGVEISFLDFLSFIGIGVGIGVFWLLIGIFIPYFIRLKRHGILACIFYFIILQLFIIESVDDIIPVTIMMGYLMFLLFILLFNQNRNNVVLRFSDVRKS